MIPRLSMVSVSACLIIVASAATGGHGGAPDPRFAESEQPAEIAQPAPVLTGIGAGSGWEKNFKIEGAEGGNLLKVKGRIQLRYNFTQRDEDVVGIGADNDTSVGFSLRRTRLDLSGKVADDRFGYRVQGDFSQSSGRFRLLDAHITFKAGGGLSFRVGQMRGPGLREDMVSSGSQLLPERSTVNTAFRQNDTQGVEATWSNDRLRVIGYLFDGVRTRNSPFTSAAEADAALAFRIERLFADGDWSRFKDFTSFRGSPFAALLGGSVIWQTGGDTNPASVVGRIDELTLVSADLSLEGDGWNAYAQGLWNRIDQFGTPAFDDYGVLVQGGAFVSDRVELVARWDAIFPDPNRGAISSEFHTVSAGFNWYVIPESHALKVSTGVQVFLDDQAGIATLVRPNPGQGLLASADGGQVALTAQIQLNF